MTDEKHARDLVADALRAACERKGPENPLRGADVTEEFVGDDMCSVLDEDGEVWFDVMVIVRK